MLFYMNKKIYSFELDKHLNDNIEWVWKEWKSAWFGPLLALFFQLLRLAAPFLCFLFGGFVGFFDFSFRWNAYFRSCYFQLFHNDLCI